MDAKPPYRKWVGVVLGLLLHGSAHFLAGGRAAGLKWYFGLFACGVAAVALLATPGTPSFIAGVVFRTDGIESLPPGTFYIERIGGLPSERIRIDPPSLIVNDEKVTVPAIFNTISRALDGYAGYQLAAHAGHSFWSLAAC